MANNPDDAYRFQSEQVNCGERLRTGSEPQCSAWHR